MCGRRNYVEAIPIKLLSQAGCGTGSPADRSIIKAVLRIGFGLPRSPKAVALGVSLVLSALLTAAALRLLDQQWLAWTSFLPLFVVVRSLRPPAAALAGGFWGGCLYLFASAVPTPAIDTMIPTVGPSVWLFALLIVIPAVYVGLAARPTRAIGFKLLILALGWTLVETVLHLYNGSNPHEGLLTASQAEAPHLHWLARLLCYVATAFLVACANASLVGIVSGARLSFPACRSLRESPKAIGWLPSQVFLAIRSWTLRRAYPRAPPIPVTVPSWNLVGDAHALLPHNYRCTQRAAEVAHRVLTVNAKKQVLWWAEPSLQHFHVRNDHGNIY